MYLFNLFIYYFIFVKFILKCSWKQQKTVFTSKELKVVEDLSAQTERGTCEYNLHTRVNPQTAVLSAGMARFHVPQIQFDLRFIAVRELIMYAHTNHQSCSDNERVRLMYFTYIRQNTNWEIKVYDMPLFNLHIYVYIYLHVHARNC